MLCGDTCEDDMDNIIRLFALGVLCTVSVLCFSCKLYTILLPFDI